MKADKLAFVGVVVASALLWSLQIAAQQRPGSAGIKHVLLLSIDGMHAVDFYNCSRGIEGVNGGDPYCPNMAALSRTGINYVATSSSKPSDSFPGMSPWAWIRALWTQCELKAQQCSPRLLRSCKSSSARGVH